MNLGHWAKANIQRLGLEVLEPRLALSGIGLVDDPSFEAGSPSEWYTSGSSSLALLPRPDAPDGARVAFISNRPTQFDGLGQDILGNLQRDADYEISAWVRLATPGTTDEVVLQIQLGDDRGVRYPTVASGTVTGDTWTRLVGGFRLGYVGELTSLHVQLNGPAAAADFLVDDLRICEHDWRAVTGQRIEQFRKRDAVINFVDAAGNPANVAYAQALQVGHDFGFGSVFGESELDNPQYTQFFTDYFEWATPENAWKWRFNEPIQDVEQYDIEDFSADDFAQFARDNALKVRGHTTFWESEFGMPNWVLGPNGDNLLSETELAAEVFERIESLTSRYKDDVQHWDVINEMLNNSFLTDNLDTPGTDDNIRLDIFNAVAEADPDAQLFLNEFGIINGEGNGANFVELIQDFLAAGAPLGGLGVQGHHDDPYAISSLAVEMRLADLFQFDLPVWITELDIVKEDVVERAKDLEVMYRTAFSLPEVDGILLWGFWAGSHWKEDDDPDTPSLAALVEQDWTVNAAGEMYHNLINEWTTFVPGRGNQLSFRGYHGTYEVAVALDDGTVSLHVLELDSTSTAAAQFVIDVSTAPAVPGDGNLDGFVDGLDFQIWRTNQFLTNTDVTSGDFNGDGVTNVLDYNVWNRNKFSGASLAQHHAPVGPSHLPRAAGSATAQVMPDARAIESFFNVVLPDRSRERVTREISVVANDFQVERPPSIHEGEAMQVDREFTLADEIYGRQWVSGRPSILDDLDATDEEFDERLKII